ncbi:hypothetical protein HDU67_009836 [Dinochytrium kinnereticum]|nr:hypothetical protein HDU67_009836 [Dinochytrium kinnereticum]
MSIEIWELIFCRVSDPFELMVACKTLHGMSCQSTNKASWLRYHYGNWAKMFSASCFQSFDAVEPSAMLASINKLIVEDFGANQADTIFPQRVRLFKLMRDLMVLPKLLGMNIDDIMFSSGSHSSTPTRAARRMFRFACWSGNVEAVNLILDNSSVISSNRKELSVGAAYAISSSSIKCLLPILVRRPALEKNGHNAFCEAIRTDQTHVAELLMDYYYRGVMNDRRDIARSARIDGIGWAGTALTLHYLLKSGASMLYFDWDYYAQRAHQRQRKSSSGDIVVFGDLVPVLHHHLHGMNIELEDFAEEAILAGCSYNDIEFLDSLLSLGLDLSEGGDDALQTAATLGNYKAVEWLLDHSVDAGYDDSAALRAASANGYALIVTLLGQRGADVKAKNNEAILRASSNGFASCVSACIELGANIHEDKNAALRAACQANHVHVVEILLSSGASPCEALGLSESVIRAIGNTSPSLHTTTLEIGTLTEVEVKPSSIFSLWPMWKSLFVTYDSDNHLSWIDRRVFCK